MKQPRHRGALIPGAPSASDQHEPGEAQPIERRDTLEPGCYWRVMRPAFAEDPHFTGRTVGFTLGHIHLLLDVFVYQGNAHSVTLLEHPSSGTGHLKLLLSDFLNAFEPVSDEEARADRERSQQDIMDAVADIQAEMAQAQVNPLALP